MTKPLIICDDSRMARKQLARCLPEAWDVTVEFAEDGSHLLSLLDSIDPVMIFLDLNMPELDGYQTLEEMNLRSLDFDVIVVSGDIQPEAKERVLALGAIDFIKKPVSPEKLAETLASHGIFSAEQVKPKETLEFNDLSDRAHFLDACQEVANIAMGRAGDSLARFLNVFVELPVPKVNEIEMSELKMALQFAGGDESVSAVCQGFVGPGLSGEALLIFRDSHFSNIAKLMQYKGDIDNKVELELLMDISNILVGASLQGFADQLDLSINQSHPVVLGQHVRFADLLSTGQNVWHKTLSIEISFSIENASVDCDLLFLFTENCIDILRERISYIV